MCDKENLLDSLVRQITSNYNPEKIILFGSQATGRFTEDSDFDFCIIANSENKRQTLTELYCAVDAEFPIDFILYTPAEWEKNVTDPGSFAFQIEKEGIKLYGR